MNADATEARVGDDIVARSGLEREQVGTAACSDVLETLVPTEVLQDLLCMLTLDRESARHAHDRTQAAVRRKRPRKVQRKGCASCAFQCVMNARTADVSSVGEANEP
jgi:hypothetical protein